jgi:hypothetical protein
LGEGTCTFEDGHQVKGSFRIECDTDGNIEGELTPSDNGIFELHQRLTQRARLNGQVKNPSGQVVLSTIMLFGFHMSMPGGSSFRFALIDEMRVTYGSIPENAPLKLRFGLANFLFFPSQAEPTSNGWSARKLPLVLREKRFEFILLDDYRTVRDRLSALGARELTTEAFVECFPSEIKTMKQAMWDEALLLSFAAGTWISVLFIDTLIQGNLVMTEIWSTKTYPYHDEPLLDSLASDDLRRFVTGGMTPLSSLRDKLQLGFALEYCILSKISPAVQVKFIVIFIAMEALLERLQNHIPHSKRRLFSWSKLLSVLGGGERSKVLNRLRLALEYYQIEDRFGVSNCAASPNFEDIRNRLVHSGDFPRGVDQVLCYRQLQDVYQQLLLAILEYDGEYYDCTQSPIVKRRLRAIE